MIYEANTIQWQPGSIVIHDSDAKEPKMLMKVIRIDPKTNIAQCRYLSSDRTRGLLPNGIERLHDPARFAMRPEWGEGGTHYLRRVQENWERARLWNYWYKPGQRVLTSSADGGFEDCTADKAYVDYAGGAVVRLVNNGVWSLQFTEAIRESV